MNISICKTNVSIYVMLVALFIVMLPMGTMYISGMGSLLKVFGIIPVAYWLCCIHKIRINVLLTTVACFVGICVISTLWSVAESESLERSITQISFLLLIMSALGNKYSYHEIDLLKRAGLYSSRFTALLVLIFGGYYEGRLTLTGVIQEDPNYLCAYFFFGLAYCILAFFSSELTTLKKVLYAIEFVVYVYIIFATGSRGGLLAAIVCVGVCYLYCQHKRNMNIIRICLSFIIMLVFCVAAYFVITKYVDINVLQRYSKETLMETNGTGRFKIWAQSLSVYSNSDLFRQLFGYGTNTITEVLNANFYNQRHVAHNIFIENLVEIGAVGFCAYILMIISYVKRSISRNDCFCMSVLFGMIVLSLSTSLSCFKPYWDIMIIICCLNSIECDAEKRM